MVLIFKIDLIKSQRKTVGPIECSFLESFCDFYFYYGNMSLGQTATFVVFNLVTIVDG